MKNKNLMLSMVALVMLNILLLFNVNAEDNEMLYAQIPESYVTLPNPNIETESESQRSVTEATSQQSTNMLSDAEDFKVLLLIGVSALLLFTVIMLLLSVSKRERESRKVKQ